MAAISTADAPRLSLCMIVRDSSRTLDACLASIAPWVDEIIVVDTGSLDNTREIAERYAAQVFEFPWCDDFAAARNESLRHAAGDWLFWMDSDDTISPENGERLRALAHRPLIEAPTAYVMQVHCPGPTGTTDCTIVDHVKMFGNDPRLRFDGRIHEQILPAIRHVGGTVEWTDIYVSHSGSEHSPNARLQKQQRDLRLLEMELGERPDHPFVLFNLGMTYADMEETEQAAAYLEKCLLVSTPDESHVRKAYALLVGCLTQLRRDSEARRVLGRGQELFPEDPELWFRLGALEQQGKNHDEAIKAYRTALSSQPNRYFMSRDRGITGYKARHNLAGVYRELGRLDLAELQWRLALEEEPTYRDGWRGLVDTLLDQKKYSTLEMEIALGRNRVLPSAELASAAARLEAIQGRVDEALVILEGAISEESDAVDLIRLKCQLLFEHLSPQQAIAALEQLCRKSPDDGAAWHNLGTAYQLAGCAGLAVNSYYKSLALRPDAVNTLIQLSHVLRELQRYRAAKASLEQALQLEPENLDVRSAISEIQEMATAV